MMATIKIELSSQLYLLLILAWGVTASSTFLLFYICRSGIPIFVLTTCGFYTIRPFGDFLHQDSYSERATWPQIANDIINHSVISVCYELSTDR
jgi:hypothetical protein